MVITSRDQIDKLLVGGYCWNIGVRGSCFILYDRFPNSIASILDVDNNLQLGIEDIVNSINNYLRFGQFCQVGYDYDKRCVFARGVEKRYTGPYCEDVDYMTIMEADGENIYNSLLNLERSLNKNENHRLIRGGKL